MASGTSRTYELHTLIRPVKSPLQLSHPLALSRCVVAGLRLLVRTIHHREDRGRTHITVTLILPLCVLLVCAGIRTACWLLAWLLD